MTDKEYAPLTTLCVRSLNDKLYEKRKVGALEIEKMVKEFAVQNQDGQIKRILRILGDDFAGSTNPNTKKGGLIGLAAAAIALGKESAVYVNELVKPVMSCFRDQDSRVRYYSCEALYNIVKVTRGAVLPFFNEIFDALSKLAADPDQNVKNGTELLDRLIKDIVTESSSFDLVAFIPLLRERIYAPNQCARQFIVSWIALMDAVPDINMVVYLPEILDGLFQILGDPSQEIRKLCLNVLAEFLTGIKNSQYCVNFAGMANFLIIHSQNTDDLISYTAITWLREFVALAGRTMLPFVSGILNAILPSLVATDIETRSKKSVKEAAASLNMALMNLIDKLDDNPTPAVTPTDSQVTMGTVALPAPADPGSEVTGDSADRRYQLAAFAVPTSCVQLDVMAVINVLCQLTEHKEFQTRIAALQWFCHLLNKVPNKTFRYMTQVFPVLLGTLADHKQSDEAVLLGLQALAEISSSPSGHRAINNKTGSAGETSPELPGVSENSPGRRVTQVVERCPGDPSSQYRTVPNEYFTLFMVELVKLFKKDRQLLQKRGPFIIRQLCLLLSSVDIFRSLSEILTSEVEMKFACTMVQTLNTILLTSTELFELRNQLKELSNQESCDLFCCLYKSWSHSPVATISLCYLSQNYSHASQLLPTFGSLEITVDFLNEIDKLIQLIESPIFAYLRLQLLDAEHSQDLIKSLYGLLMLLPQSEAFHLLRRRLNCIPNFQLAPQTDRLCDRKHVDSRDDATTIHFDELLEHFQQVQARHKEAKRNHAAFLSTYHKETAKS